MMKTDLIKIPNGIGMANTYIIRYDDKNCYVIDPSDDFKQIDRAISENYESVKAVLLTHGHFDHIGSVDRVVEKYNCPVYLNKKDEFFVRKPSGEIDPMMAAMQIVLKTEIIDTSLLDDPNIVVLNTPGHSIGSVCFVFKKEKILFSGDTLFAVDIGRTDLMSGSFEQMVESLKLLKTLNDDLTLHPGHEESSTLGHEKKYNLYLSKV